MKLSNKTMIDFVRVGVAKKKLPVKLAYALAVNITVMDSALKAYDEERIKLVDKFAKKGDNGEPIIENNNYIIEKQDEWNKSITELLEAEADLSVTTISVDDLEKCDSPEFDSLSVEELAAIKFMIV